MSTTTQHIWNPESGITDIEVPWKDLAGTEVDSIKRIWAEQRERLKGTSQLHEFTERLSREWAIETGIIENLYDIDRGITQTLIERGFHAEFLTHGSTNKPPSYVINLLEDQQDALDGVFDFIKQDRKLSTSYIKELHASLVRSQDTTDAQDPSGKMIQIPLIKGDWKMQRNYPTKAGVIFAYCPPEQVASEMDRLVEIHQRHIADGIAPEVEAAWMHHRFTQIHPFQDGNGRVARTLSSMVLVRAGLFPLVVTRDDKDRYLNALEAADNGNLKPLVDFLVALQRAQFRKFTALSENMVTAGAGLASVMENLKKAAAKSSEFREQERKKVFDYSKSLESDTKNALEGLLPDLQQVMLRLNRNGAAFVTSATPATNHWHIGSVIHNAKEHLNYFADTSTYRSWVALNMSWDRKARLVFHFHAIGRPFSGSMACAPFLEFRDSDEDDHIQSTIVPVTDEAFVFFYTEPIENVGTRFRTWRETVVTVAMKQLGDSL